MPEKMGKVFLSPFSELWQAALLLAGTLFATVVELLTMRKTMCQYSFRVYSH